MRSQHSNLRKSICFLTTVVSIGLVSTPAIAIDGRDMTVRRRNTFDQHVRDREARERRERYAAEQAAYEAELAKDREERRQRRRNGGKTDEEIELENFGTRTLGGACMYGTKGEVIYRPRGATCKGDAPRPLADEQLPASEAPAPRSAAPTRKSRPDARRVEASPGSRSGSSLTEGPRRGTRRKPRCVWVDGRIAFQPEGVDCYAN